MDILTTEEQRAKYMPQVKALRIIGGYAQTELGHGTNVAGLETTATLDMKTDEWVINTPTTRAYKFWPGTMGIFGNHVVLFARCIIGEKDYGPQPFFVQTRSFEEHMPMPRVTVGDIGPKMTYGSVDNGFLAFDQVRIPREDMLQRFSGVSKDGKFSQKGDPRALYVIMVQMRLLIIGGAGDRILNASLMATRYAACRRQFKNIPNSDMERKLIDYQTHIALLGNNISTAWVLAMTVHIIRDKFNEGKELILKNDYSAMELLHHLTSGVKALSAKYAVEGIDALRQGCGGAGFQLSSGICALWLDTAPYNTFEGVEVVML